ncbi:MAG: XRE family transcriptional regulator [Pyrinomonadaceae bacterium]
MKNESYTARNANELANLLGLDAADAIEIEFRAKLNKKIIDTVKTRKLTHAQAAQMASTSRTRITAILNGNTSGVSSDLLLRILYSLGFKAKVTFAPVQPAI